MPDRDDDEDSDDAIAGRIPRYMRNERMPSRMPVSTDMAQIERIIVFATKAAVDASTEKTEKTLKETIAESQALFLQRLGIPDTEEGFTSFRKNQEWAQDQRALRALVKKVGVGAAVTTLCGMGFSAAWLLFQSKVGGK